MNESCSLAFARARAAHSLIRGSAISWPKMGETYLRNYLLWRSGPWDATTGLEKLLLMEALEDVDPTVRLQPRPTRVCWTPPQQVRDHQTLTVSTDSKMSLRYDVAAASGFRAAAPARSNAGTRQCHQPMALVLYLQEIVCDDSGAASEDAADSSGVTLRGVVLHRTAKTKLPTAGEQADMAEDAALPVDDLDALVQYEHMVS